MCCNFLINLNWRKLKTEVPLTPFPADMASFSTVRGMLIFNVAPTAAFEPTLVLPSTQGDTKVC